MWQLEFSSRGIAVQTFKGAIIFYREGASVCGRPEFFRVVKGGQ